MLRREVRRGFCQELAFHPEFAVLPLKLAQPRPLGHSQWRLFLRVLFPVSLHPVTERNLMHPDLAGDMGDRPGGIDHQPAGFFLKLRGVVLTLSWHSLSSFPVRIL